MDYQKLTRLSAVFLINPGLAALLLLLLSFVHMGITTSMSTGVGVSMICTLIPLVLNFRAILLLKSESAPSESE